MKRLASLLLSLAMTLALLPAAAAPARAESGGVQTDYEPETGVLTVTLPEAPTEAMMLIAAGYDGVGRMTDVSVRRLEAGAETEQTFEGLAESFLYKAFLLGAPEEAGAGGGGVGAAAYGAPVAPSSVSEKNYAALGVARGQVYLPVLDGAIAHSTAMAVDAYVEAEAARESVLSLFEDTTQNYESNGETRRVNALAALALSGTDAEKYKALLEIQRALGAEDQAVRAAAVLDASAGRELAVAQAELEESAAGAALVLASSDDKHEEALKWAKELSDKWDATERKGKLKNFAEQLGVDARTAHQALQDAQAILRGEYEAEAKFYDTCTRVAIGVKTASKVGVFVCATIATGGAASAAGGLTVAEAAGIAVGGVDCAVEMGRSGMKIVLGDDHKIVQGVEERMQTYDAVMFVAGVATFDPKTASAGEKLLFVEDLIEKNIDAYENVKVCMDEATGLVVDKIENETKKIAVDYTRVEAKDPADLAQAARELLDASDTGIMGIDPTLNDGTAEQQKQDYVKSVDSGDTELRKTYSVVKDSALPSLESKVEAFADKCDERVEYEPMEKEEDDPGGPPPPPPPGGPPIAPPEVPPPEPDIDSIERVYDEEGHLTEENYYDSLSYYDEETGFWNRDPIGRKTYRYDKDTGTYWPVEEWYSCGDGKRVTTRYYQKNEEETFSARLMVYNISPQTFTATEPGHVHNRYMEEKVNGSWRYAGEYLTYYPGGQLKDRCFNSYGSWYNDMIEYSPEGYLYYYSVGLNRMTYYIYPEDLPFNVVGHVACREYHEEVDGIPDKVREVRYTPGQVGTVEEKYTDSEGHEHNRISAYQYGWFIRTLSWPDGGYLDQETTQVVVTIPVD